MLDEQKSRPYVERALQLGINFFDTADFYSNGRSEEIVGQALADFAHRDEVVLASKVFFPMGKKPNQGGLSRKHIVEGCHASLKRLKTDYHKSFTRGNAWYSDLQSKKRRGIPCGFWKDSRHNLKDMCGGMFCQC